MVGESNSGLRGTGEHTHTHVRGTAGGLGIPTRCVQLLQWNAPRR